MKSPILAGSVETFNGLDYVLSRRKVIKLWWDFKRGMKAIIGGLLAWRVIAGDFLAVRVNLDGRRNVKIWSPIFAENF